MNVPTLDRLLRLVDLMADQPVLMMADLVVDRFIHGAPKRISREAPVLILEFQRESLTPGGGANAVANVAALGGRPLPVGVVGDDDSGQRLIACFADAGIVTDGIVVLADYSTPTKTRILAGGRHAIKQQIVRYDIDDQVVLDDALHGQLLERMKALAPSAKAAVLSDYGYGAVVPGWVSALRQALDPQTPILGDSRYRLHEFRDLDGATPNLEEAEAWFAGPLDERLEQGGAELRKALGGELLLITRGSSGMTLLVESGAYHLPVHGTDQVADVTGAGDTVIGTFALALAAGGSALEAACLANYAGGVVVMKMGTATLDRTELRDAIRSDPDLLGRIRGS